MVTDEQVRLLRAKRMSGKTQELAAASAGMSVRTARSWESGPLPSSRRGPRTWRTRRDPFEDVWERDVVPFLVRDERGRLLATTLFDELQQRHPGRFPDGLLRTFQRRVRDWRALHGAEKEVFFEQEHVPGREGALDFTHGLELGVTIDGRVFDHLLFTFRLSYSGWHWADLAYGETFEALQRGTQSALFALGGVPSVLRSDNLSAATRELKRTGGRVLTERWQGVLDHYGCKSSLIQAGRAHENGVAEKGNALVKRLLGQRLLVRGHKDFGAPESYLGWVKEQVERHLNEPVGSKLDEERPHLRPLPLHKLPDWTTYRPTVRKWSTVRIGARAYSVPSRLIGHEVEARQFADIIEIWFRDQKVASMPRLRGGMRARIDYRDIIWSLVRKPGAFARYRYREELFPTETFRRAYDRLTEHFGERADVEYVRILHLAASTMESRVDHALADLLARGGRLSYADVQEHAAPSASAVPQLKERVPDLTVFDRLIGGVR